ncbi:Mercuric resistance operon regulatory protein [Halomicronema hongdechloris C2206]|uniref:Mercuric resistance operon regulatory protein n=1 Tax=Halomicronema hongdechloris C2206 TaxID=1641165 RepID=A0A1Z3HTD8_9CYAN|nr:heavy metal-responsive transcriptional regulator [Halomicronema hongdechloris]ASC73573.1 Mercuric resistance operon regulatory protein [Halomicronema hongdechloris C2206]
MVETASTLSSLLRIGELSRASGVPVKTIRYYEDLNLIQATRRTSGGFRLFSPQTQTRLHFIKRAQTLGLSLQEIHDILAIHDRGDMPCQEVRQTLQKKITVIEQRIDELSLLRRQLIALMRNADDLEMAEADICPIIERGTSPGS